MKQGAPDSPLSPFSVGFLASVPDVAEDRASYGRHVDPGLVGPSRHEVDLHEGGVVSAAEKPEPGQGFFAGRIDPDCVRRRLLQERRPDLPSSAGVPPPRG